MADRSPDGTTPSLDFRWMRDALDHADVTATLESQARSPDPQVAARAQQQLEQAVTLYRHAVSEKL